MTKTIGVLTGGGDCPGINAVIRGIVLRAAKYGANVIGFRRGWQGLLDGGQTTRLDIEDVEEIHALGGTIIGTSRTDPFAVENGPDQVRRNLQQNGCEALIVIGGEKTLGIAYRLSQSGLPIVGVPKTVDNNVSSTDCTFGFHTAINTATDAIDRLATTAKSHGVVLVIQVMGRNAGWLALYASIATAAQDVLIPEQAFDLDKLCKRIQKRHENGAEASIIVVAEGARPTEPNTLNVPQIDMNGHNYNGVAKEIARVIHEQTGIESRHAVLGPLQRSGSPTAFDRVLGLRFGAKAVELIHARQFGTMASVRGNEILAVPLEDAVKKPRTVDELFFNETCEFFT